MPYFNEQTGEPTDGPEWDRRDRARPLRRRTGAAGADTAHGCRADDHQRPHDQETVAIASLTPEAALTEYDRMTVAWRRTALGDDRTPRSRRSSATRRAIMRGNGLPLDDNRVLGEVFAGGQIGPLDADALVQRRAAVPDGYAFDEAATGDRGDGGTHDGRAAVLIMEITAALAETLGTGRAARRGGVERWGGASGADAAAWARRHGPARRQCAVRVPRAVRERAAPPCAARAGGSGRNGAGIPA